MMIEDAVFTVFDFETTGLHPYAGDKICEIGALRAGFNSTRSKRFHSLIDPERCISPGAFKVNGISDEIIKGKPLIKDVLPDFLKFIEGSVLVAYNAGFDVGFLAASMGPRAEEVLERYYIIDALRLARRLFPDLGRYGLGHVASSLDIEASIEHRALSDAAVTWKLFRKELSALKQTGASKIEDIDRFRLTPSRAPSAAMEGNVRLFNDAIRMNGKLSIVYKSLWTDRSTRRVISPKQIRHGHNYSYIIAYCHLRQEERTFRLDCIIAADVV